MGDSKTNWDGNYGNWVQVQQPLIHTPSRRMGDSKTNHRDQQPLVGTPLRRILHSQICRRDMTSRRILHSHIDFTAGMGLSMFPSVFPSVPRMERSASFYVSRYGRNLLGTPLPQVEQSYNTAVTATGSDPVSTTEELYVVVDWWCVLWCVLWCVW